MTRGQMRKLIQALLKLRESATDEIALESIGAYPKWKTETEYKVDERVQYDEKLYKCLQDHTSQSTWMPDVSPSLWVRVYIEEFPEWTQPLGSTDAYPLGARVSHGERDGVKIHWESLIDANVYEPGVYGWKEIE